MEITNQEMLMIAEAAMIRAGVEQEKRVKVLRDMEMMRERIDMGTEKYIKGLREKREKNLREAFQKINEYQSCRREYETIMENLPEGLLRNQQLEALMTRMEQGFRIAGVWHEEQEDHTLMDLYDEVANSRS